MDWCWPVETWRSSTEHDGRAETERQGSPFGERLFRPGVLVRRPDADGERSGIREETEFFVRVRLTIETERDRLTVEAPNLQLARFHVANVFGVAAEDAVSGRLGEDVARGHLLDDDHIEQAVFDVRLPAAVDESPDVTDECAQHVSRPCCLLAVRDGVVLS